MLSLRASEAEKASLHEPDEAKSSSSNPDGGEAHAQGDGGAELSPSGNESGRDDGSGGYGVDDSHVVTGGDSLDGEEEVSVNTTPNPARVHELEAEVAALQLRSLEEVRGMPCVQRCVWSECRLLFLYSPRVLSDCCAQGSRTYSYCRLNSSGGTCCAL